MTAAIAVKTRSFSITNLTLYGLSLVHSSIYVLVLRTVRSTLTQHVVTTWQQEVVYIIVVVIIIIRQFVMRRNMATAATRAPYYTTSTARTLLTVICSMNMKTNMS